MRRNIYGASTSRLALIATMLVLALCAGASFAQTFPTVTNWQDWHYYVDVNVDTGAYTRTATPVELQINFTKYLNGATFDPNSVRVGEFADSGRTGTPVEVISQFDKASDFAAATNASGEVVWILRGTPADPNALSGAVPTDANTKRYYRVYFDDTINPKSDPSYASITSLDAVTLDVTVGPGKYGLMNNHYIVSPGNYRATFYDFNGYFIKLDNLRVGDKTLIYGNSFAYSEYTGGAYYTSKDNGAQVFSCKTYNAGLNYYRQSANSAVRCTVTVSRNDTATGRNHEFITAEKFYAGVPYFKNETTINRSSSDAGKGFFEDYGFRYGFVESGIAPYRTLGLFNSGETDPVTGTETGYSAYFDWSADRGGIAVLGSPDYMPVELQEGSTVVNGITLTYRGMHSTTNSNRYWRYIKSPYYPLTITHGVAVHNGLDEETARTSTQKSLQDYGCPVEVMVVGSSTTAVGYGSIKGNVTNALDSNKPVRGALVRLWVDNAYVAKAYTSVLGDFTFSNVVPGTAKISVKCDTFDTKTESIGTVATGAVTSANVSLQPIIVANAAVPNWQWVTSGWTLATDSKVYEAVTKGTDVATYASKDYDASFDSLATVPGDWDGVQGSTDNVYGWYHTIVNIPSQWVGKNLRIRNFFTDDVAAIYFNEQFVGQIGSFPNVSDPRTATAGNGYVGRPSYPIDFIIRKGTFSAGPNMLAIKVFDSTGTGGILNSAPLIEVTADSPVVTVNVTGPQVYNGPKLPVKGADVTFFSMTSGQTGDNGKCTFSSIPSDVYTLTVNHPRYGTKTLTVDIPETGDYEIPVEYDSFLCDVTGTVTKNNVPVGNARVVINSGGSSCGGLTDSTGTYTLTGVKSGVGTLIANGNKAVPTTVDQVDLKALQVTLPSVNINYGVAPLYDDFNGTSLDTEKWELFSKSGDTTGTIVSTEGGFLSIESATGGKGIISKVKIPAVGVYECVFPKRFYENGTQDLCIVKDKESANANYIDFQDAGGYTGCLYLVAYSPDVAGADKVLWRTGQLYDCPFPGKVTVVRTGNYYDVYAKDILRGSASTERIPGDGYIYLSGDKDGYDPVDKAIAYFDDIRAGVPVAVAPATLAEARAALDGTDIVTSGAVVTASYDNYFFVENTDRSAGIKVVSAAKPKVGRTVYVAGKATKSNSESAINATEVNVGTVATAVPPPVAITGKIAGELDKAGAAAQGMLVKVAGKVTSVHLNASDKVDGYFLDDGSGIVGDGTKGIFVEVDPAWNVTSSIVGTFKTIVSPLTVKKISDTVVLPAVKDVFETPSTYTIYNDCSWSSGQTSGNITTYGTGTGFSGSTSGDLKEYTIGASFPVTVALTKYGNVTWNAAGGADCLSGTDAGNTFGGKVSFTGYINCESTDAHVDVTFSGLDPNGSYEFAATANGADGNYYTKTRYTILGVQSFTNASSSDATMSSDGTYTEFCTGDNTGMGPMGGMYFGGCIAKWTNIKPSTNGTFTVRASVADNGTSAYAFSAFMLKKN
ncbi:MAG: carboxypeptidase-like regulatory domain-containing protein [Armatimonadota bacterium]